MQASRIFSVRGGKRGRGEGFSRPRLHHVIMAAQRASRLKKELERLRKDPPYGVTCWSKEDCVDCLQAQLLGAQGTPYEGGIFSLDIRIPDRYPFQPPQVQFVTPIYHPNVDNAGRICLDVLKSQPQGSWKPAHNLSTVLTSIQLLLSDPNPDDGLMADISHEYKHNRPQFLEKARLWVKKHASGSTGDSNTKIQGRGEYGDGNQSRKRKLPSEIGVENDREVKQSRIEQLKP